MQRVKINYTKQPMPVVNSKSNELLSTLSKEEWARRFADKVYSLQDKNSIDSLQAKFILEQTLHHLNHANPNKARQLLDAIQGVYLILNTNEVSQDEQSAMCLKIIEGIVTCSDGFLTRLLSLLVLQTVPKNLNEFLTEIRRDIVEKITLFELQRLGRGGEVHAYNHFFKVASEHFGVVALNLDDPYASGLRDEAIHQALSAAFNKQHHLFGMLHDLETQIRGALAKLGYFGLINFAEDDYKEDDDKKDGYKTGDLNQFISFFNALFQTKTIEMPMLAVLDDNYAIHRYQLAVYPSSTVSSIKERAIYRGI